MMGIDCIFPIVRSKSTVDTSILKSKIGHAILKGGTFYSKLLTKKLHQLTLDARTEVRIINYQMKSLIEKNQKNMKRSEKLVTTYNLPPIKTGSNRKSDRSKATPDISVTGQSIQGIQAKDKDIQATQNNLPDENPSKSFSEGNKFFLSTKDDSKLLRRTICSPVPSKYQVDSEERNTEHDIQSLNITSSAFPHITVDQCEEVFPPLKKENVQRPEYALCESQSRTGSTNSLGVPSPIIKRRSTDGKIVNIPVPSGNLSESNLSRSEGSIPDALKKQRGKDDPRFKALEAVLKPTTTPRANTRTPTKDLQKTKEEARRTVSRSVSPKPRFSNIRQTKTTNYTYCGGPKTPP